jgi:hypothetical protein
MKKSDHPVRRLLVVGATGAIAATAANVLIYGAGRAADVAYIVSTTSQGNERVRLADVVSLSLMSFAVGIIAAVVARRFRRPSVRTLQVVGAVLAVVTTWGDFVIDGTPAAKATLAVMHIVVGVAYIISLQAASTRRTHVPSETALVRTLEPVAA